MKNHHHDKTCSPLCDPPNDRLGITPSHRFQSHNFVVGFLFFSFFFGIFSSLLDPKAAVAISNSQHPRACRRFEPTHTARRRHWGKEENRVTCCRKKKEKQKTSASSTESSCPPMSCHVAIAFFHLLLRLNVRQRKKPWMKNSETWWVHPLLGPLDPRQKALSISFRKVISSLRAQVRRTFRVM